MPISGRFWTTQELQALLGVSKQGVHKLAQTHNWASPYRGLYHAADVDEYLWARWRKQIMGTRELVWHDEHDLPDNCPACGAFALAWPDDEHYACVNGHTGLLI